MRKQEKIENEKFYVETLEQWLLKRGYYNHNIDCLEAYWFMYDTFWLSWHKVQRLILKKVSKEVLDKVDY